MMSRFRLVVLGAVVGALLSGCYFSPRTESEALSAKVDRDEYWTRDEVPTLDGEREVQTVAIAEFGIEFVTHKMLTNGPGAAWVDPTQFVPWGIGLKVIGLGRRRVDFGDALMNDLPEELYAELVTWLQVHEGVEVIAPERVRAAIAYRSYETQREDDTSILRFLNPFGSDTGRIRSIETRSHRGLPLIVGTKASPNGGEGPKIEDVDAALMRELGVDQVMRVRFRIGVHNKLASIERDSEIVVTGEGQSGSLVSRRSLTSDDPITANCGFLPFRGMLYEVDEAKYRTAIKRIMVVYLDLFAPEVPANSLASR